MASYLHIITSITITAPIRTWQALTTTLQDTKDYEIANHIHRECDALLSSLLNRPTFNERNVTWDYDHPLTIDNLSPDDAGIIKEAWGKR